MSEEKLIKSAAIPYVIETKGREERVYDIYSRTNMSSAEGWLPEGRDLPGTGSNLVIIITNDAPMRCHRTGVRLP